MPDVTTHKPGMFCWTDLNTPDPAGAEAFYGELFDWTFEDLPMPGGAPYSMARRRGRDAAAIAGILPDSERLGIRPHWNVYFAVESADAAAAIAGEAGGLVVAPPFDVMDVGRMAVLTDPDGGTFCVWEARKHRGAGVTGEPGAITWAELGCRQPQKCEPFYARLFGWKPETSQFGGEPYTVFSLDQPAAGMMRLPSQIPSTVPSHWTPYFAIERCDATFAQAQSRGARPVVQPTDIPDVGRFAMFFDPQGAAFAVIQPAARSR